MKISKVTYFILGIINYCPGRLITVLRYLVVESDVEACMDTAPLGKEICPMSGYANTKATSTVTLHLSCKALLDIHLSSIDQRKYTQQTTFLFKTKQKTTPAL
jgi:hypothetical protein